MISASLDSIPWPGTRHSRAVCALLLFSSAAVGPLGSQTTGGSTPGDWSVSAPPSPARQIQFETSRGTWMSLDVSPDGRWIVFDLLGDLYIMPSQGGRATPLASGPAHESQPRFSPDGRRIAFTSDRDGLENLWVMDLDGGNFRQITHERERQVSNPAWTPDGQHLVGRKHFRLSRSLGAGEIWLYGVADGSEAGLTHRRTWEHNATEPIVSPDGRYVFFTEDVSEGEVFQYNRNPHGVIYVVQRLDRRNGQRDTWLDAPGGSLAPRISPDGRTMAFVRRVGPRTALMLHDMESGRERMLWDGLDRDQQEGWALFGTYPGYAWTPAGDAVVIWAQGRIWRVDADSGEPREIPFQAPVELRVTDPVRAPARDVGGDFQVRTLRGAIVSPDGSRVVFSALGKLWVQAVGGGAPRRLTSDETHWELYPAWSPDARFIVYTTWSDADQGSVRVVQSGGGEPRRITRSPGHYVSPAFSHDGRQIVFRRVAGDALRGRLFARGAGVYTVPLAGGEPAFVTAEGRDPQFSLAADRIFLTSMEEHVPALVSVSLTGGDRRVHLRAEGASAFVASPDQSAVAVLARHQVHLATIPPPGRTDDVRTSGTGAAPMVRVAGTSLHWGGSGDRLYWTVGPNLHHVAVGSPLRGAPASTTAPPLLLGWTHEGDRPTGTLALVGGTILTMASEEAIADGTVLVERDRIVAVGPSAEVPIPEGATLVDVSGKFLMPGLIDVHAHVPTGAEGIPPQANWPLLANLAFGVTTLHDPAAADTEMTLSTAEMLRAGLIPGPRLLSSGRPLYGGETDFRVMVESFDDALAHVQRLKEAGASSVKSYNQPRRDVRQQLVEAARQLEIMIVPEGGSTYAFSISHLLDGHTGLEHNLPVSILYEDVLGLMGRTAAAYTPTLVVNYGGMYGTHFWFQENEVWNHPRLRRFTPGDQIDPRARRRQTAPLEEFSHLAAARSAKAILDHGGRVQVGAHGSVHGLGAHWEIWTLGQGGMTPFEALRAATLSGAEYLGIQGDLGSLEVGKLADLIVLDRDPMENLRNTDSVQLVMVNGRLFDAETLEQRGNHPAPAPVIPWHALVIEEATPDASPDSGG